MKTQMTFRQWMESKRDSRTRNSGFFAEQWETSDELTKLIFEKQRDPVLLMIQISLIAECQERFQKYLKENKSETLKSFRQWIECNFQSIKNKLDPSANDAVAIWAGTSIMEADWETPMQLKALLISTSGKYCDSTSLMNQILLVDQVVETYLEYLSANGVGK